MKIELTDYNMMRLWIEKDKGTSRQRLNRWKNRALKLGLPRTGATALRDRVYALIKNDRHKPKEEVSNILSYAV